MLSESEESLARQRFFALAQNDRLESASADSQDVFFEMDCALCLPCSSLITLNFAEALLIKVSLLDREAIDTFTTTSGYHTFLTFKLCPNLLIPFTNHFVHLHGN